MTDKELREKAAELLDGESYKERVDGLAAALKDAYREGVEAMQAGMKNAVAEFYPTDIFTPPSPGEHGETVDQCSAAAMRGVVPGLTDMVAARLLEGARHE